MNEDELGQAVKTAIDEAPATVVYHNVVDMRRDWIRRIAMHIAAAQMSGGLCPSWERANVARESVEIAAAVWCQLERFFEGEDCDGG